MLADVVRTYRRRLGMTQQDLAAAAKISVRSIRNIEAGAVARPRPSTIRALAAAFDLPEAARLRLHDAPTVAVDNGRAVGNGRTVGNGRVGDGPPEPLVVVSIEATGGQPDDPLRVRVTVRSATQTYSLGPIPVERDARAGRRATAADRVNSAADRHRTSAGPARRATGRR